MIRKRRKRSFGLKTSNFLAFDLGAESGRAVLGTLRDKKLQLKELARFSNSPVPILGHLYWNIFGLFEEMKKAIRLCASSLTTEVEGLAVDAWGVDFGLLAEDGSLLGMPFSYRDQRTQGAMEDFFGRFPRERIYELTGIQFMPINTLYQLYSMTRDTSALLKVAADLLFMPDLFTYLFSGERLTEFTVATTSQLFEASHGVWSDDLFAAMGISPNIMQNVISPGTVVGALLPAISAETGIPDIPVIATASHDTGAAVAAVPASGNDWAYISSGTWSLVGIETGRPIINRQSLESNFTNEGGLEGTNRFLKNVTGLWLVQQCRKSWAKGRPLSYEELIQLASSTPPFKLLIDPDSPDFLGPDDLPDAIRRYAQKTGQAPPTSPGEFVRCILESLALKYRFVFDQLNKLTPGPLQRIHLIGGGSRNPLLCQFTAEATGLPVAAGPAEATAMGNVLGQALALGYVRNLDEIRHIVRNSVDLQMYEPEHPGAWDLAYDRFLEIVALS